MSALALSLTLFCLPAIHTDADSVVQPSKETKPPRAKSDQFCVHVTISDGAGGWRWKEQAEHCDDTHWEICDHICLNYKAENGYRQVNCGGMATAEKQYMIVPPGHTPTTTPPIQYACACPITQPMPTPIRMVYAPMCLPCPPAPCQRPRLFSRLCGRR